MTRLAGWGRHPVVDAPEQLSEDLRAAVADTVLTRGLGRSYGDASLPPRDGIPVASSRRADRLLAFDPGTGIVRAEAGLTLRTLLDVFEPRGFTCPVAPGTADVTLGGMVAADVHGKNHHVAGTLGAHVTSLSIALADGRVLEVDDDTEPELLDATLGGMGLTGHVLEVALRMAAIPSPWMAVQSERHDDLDDLLAALHAARHDWPYTMAWLDGMAAGADRGVLHCGRWASAEEAPPMPPPAPRPRRVPHPFGLRLLRDWNLRLYNRLRWSRQGPPRLVRTAPARFLQPLDSLVGWNHLYGRRGMTQYQCVVPTPADDPEPVRRVLSTLRDTGGRSYLTVVKDCGDEGRGLLSFPRPGVSIALDFPVERNTQHVVDALNETVLLLGGRIYLAKDAFTRAEHFAAMEPRLPRFQSVRRRWDPECRLRSALSVRLMGDQV